MVLVNYIYKALADRCPLEVQESLDELDKHTQWVTIYADINVNHVAISDRFYKENITVQNRLIQLCMNKAR